MRRRSFLGAAWAGAFLAGARPQTSGWPSLIDADTARDWLARWEPYILRSARERFCDRELGEGIGWRISPFLNGFYYGYRATRDTRWVSLLVDWTDS